MKTLCITYGPGRRDAPFCGYDSILEGFLDDLRTSPAGARLADDASREGWTLEAAAGGVYDFQLDITQRRIFLGDGSHNSSAVQRSPFLKNELFSSLIRALRDTWQETRRKAGDCSLRPADILALERVRAADCDVLAVLCAWQMREAGHSELWRHILSSENADMAQVFMEKEGHASLAAAFEQWHRAASRVDARDHESLNYLDTMIKDGYGQDIAAGLALTPARVEFLSCLPDRTAYLRGRGGEVLTGPLYAGLNNPVNQAHFMQILQDLEALCLQEQFRDKDLAGKIFPAGQYAPFGLPTLH